MRGSGELRSSLKGVDSRGCRAVGLQLSTSFSTFTLWTIGTSPLRTLQRPSESRLDWRAGVAETGKRAAMVGDPLAQLAKEGMWQTRVCMNAHRRRPSSTWVKEDVGELRHRFANAFSGTLQVLKIV